MFLIMLRTVFAKGRGKVIIAAKSFRQSIGLEKGYWLQSLCYVP